MINSLAVFDSTDLIMFLFKSLNKNISIDLRKESKCKLDADFDAVISYEREKKENVSLNTADVWQAWTPVVLMVVTVNA